MNVHIRRADERDIPGTVAVWKELMELLRRTNPHYWEVKDGQAAFTKHLASVLASPKVLLAVAEKGGNVVGFSLAYIETLPEWFGTQRIGVIRYLAVAENYRGGGIGLQLTIFVIDWFRSVGIGRAELHVLKGLPASRFWEKLGFKEFMDRRYLEV